MLYHSVEKHYKSYSIPFKKGTDYILTGGIIPYNSSKDLSDTLIMTGGSSNHVVTAIGKYLNSGFDRSSFLKTGNSSEFSSSCTTRIVPILTTGVSFLRSYKVSNKRPIMGHPRSDVGCPGSVLVGPGQSQDGLVCLRMVQDRLGMVWVCLGMA